MRLQLAPATLAAAFCFMSTLAIADDTSNADIYAAANQAHISVGGLRQNYKEFNDGLTNLLPSVLDSEQGSIPNLQLGISLLRKRLYAELQIGVAYGSTSYTGYLQYPGPLYVPYEGSTNNLIVRTQGRVGIPFRPVSWWVFIPYVEAGDHYWRRDIGYIEDYSHFHIGVGGKMLLRVAPRVVAEAGLGTGTTFLANMRLDGDDFELGSKPYRHIMLACDIRLTEHWHLRLSSEYRLWQYGQSPVVNGLIEPRSESKQATYMVGIGYSFLR